MAESMPLQLSETDQTANPSTLLDLTPSTGADTKEAVVLEDLDDEQAIIDDEDDDDVNDDDDTPYSVIRPWHPRSGHGVSRLNKYAHKLPALPDLRFEQSYLRSISAADVWWKVALITARDQIMMPFLQGLIYNSAVCGWQFWNRSAQLSGQSAGARARRWWYGINNWPITEKAGKA